MQGTKQPNKQHAFAAKTTTKATLYPLCYLDSINIIEDKGN